MTPSEDQITALLLGGCEYARDCDKTCGEATKASCVSRNRVIEALQQAFEAGMEKGAAQ